MTNIHSIIQSRGRPAAKNRRRIVSASCNALAALLLTACELPSDAPGLSTPAGRHKEDAVEFPPETAWNDLGPIFEAGKAGDWDRYLWGGFAAAILKKDETYFLYYQGASSYRFAFDETVCGRSIGVATSRDGINFEKFADNPVIAWSPNGECEEGAASLALATDHNGNVLAFYGANTARDATNVNTDARLARSPDGLSFSDEGVVLDHKDVTVWGSGDELFPIAALVTEGMWMLYYLPNKEGFSRQLGVAWGSSPLALEQSSAVKTPTQEIVAMWGTASHIRLTPHIDLVALFNNKEDKLQVWSVSSESPQQLRKPLARHRLDGAAHAVVMLDKKRRTWFLYYQVDDVYGVKVAPYGEADKSGPSTPAMAKGTRTNATRIELSWLPATDPETGVASYNIYRNGLLVGSVKGTTFADAVFENSTANYQISAVNLHGAEGPYSAPVLVPASNAPAEDRS
jgi:hypothetical protein